MTACIVDTSVLLELLNVPGFASRHTEVLAEFVRRNAVERFLLPLVVLIETGNHIAHVPDGGARRKAAQDFVEFARRSLEGELPFVAVPAPNRDDVAKWLTDYPDYAQQQVGLADRSLIALWEHQRQLQPLRRVYIWSLDEHLVGYDHRPA